MKNITLSIKPILFGFRYCLNDLFFNNKRGIYYPIYANNNIDYLKTQYYPGNDTKLNLVYSNIINHFKNKLNEGCYVCICKKWYYHSVPSGFPGNGELNKLCPKCNGSIGSRRRGVEISIIKRDNYMRIFKDENELEETKKNINIKFSKLIIKHLIISKKNILINI